MELWKGPSIIARETRIRHNVLDKGAAAAAQDRLTLSIQIRHQMANGKRDRFLMIALGTRGRRRYYNIFYVSINFFSMLFAPLCQFFFSHLISGTSQTLLMVGRCMRTRRGKSIQQLNSIMMTGKVNSARAYIRNGKGSKEIVIRPNKFDSLP